MAPNLLVLGGTTEARTLAQRLAEEGVRATVSLAGRVARPAPQALPLRTGGFGGVAGLAAYLRREGVTHVIDATHPFAAQMSANAVSACRQAGVPLIALTRPPWSAQPGDRWIAVDDVAGAVAALDRPATRVMLAIGRQSLAPFAARPQHFYLLRVIDPPAALPLPRHRLVIERGPFTEAGDQALLEAEGIALIVSKNAGGQASCGKIAAARRLGLPVIMIARPRLPERRECHGIEDVLEWIAQPHADLGV